MAAVLIPPASLKSWEKGKATILKLCETFATDGTTAEAHGSDAESNYTQLFCELISNVVSGQIGHDEVVQLLAENIIVDDEGRRSILADVISILDVDSTFIGKSEQDRFTTFVSALVNMAVVSADLLKERIDVETLDSLGLIQSTKGFNSKFVKIKTKLFYKQQKFNLLREESEGYSKLITELGQEMDSINHMAFLENIKSLIGRFNLDPNRVLDIMLDAFEFHLEEEDFFITLLKDYSSNYDKSTVCHILGFKYQFYKDQPDVRPPHALLYLTALLIKYDLLELDNIYEYLSPSDAEINEDNTQELLDAKAEARKMNTAILTSDTNSEETKENEKEPKVEHKKFNQKFGLCHTLLLVGAWSQAKETMDKLPKFAAVSEQPVVEAMCKLIHVLIEPIYRQYSSKAARGRPYSYKLSTGPEQCRVFGDLTDCVFPLLFNLGPYLSFDPILMAKVIRVGRTFLKENPNIVSGQDKDVKLLAVWNGLIELVDQVLFPSLSLLECNPSIAEEVWILLKAFPYNIRYCLYGRWKNQSYNLHPKLIDARAKTIKKAKYIAKRLSKENVKQSGRQIGKLSHSNPGVLFEYILSQIQKYDNFIGPVVDSLKYLTPMSYDVLAYCIIEALANPEKERLKLDDTNISEWLKSLAVFCGTVFKKYSIELTGLLQYVTNQLKAGKSSDLLVLREVVQKMSGIEISEEVTMDQIEALSGGEMLRAEGGWFGQIRNTKKSSQRLRDTLMDGDLAFPLCILMAQQRNSVIFLDEPPNRHLKLIGKLYDQCHDTMVQFGGFLATQLNSEDYDNNLPPLEDLVQNFYVTQDAAFFLARPMFANKIQATFEETQKTEKSKNLSQKQIFKLYISAVNSVLEPVTLNVVDLHPLRVWNNISPQLYVAFWSLTTYDLHVPVERYDAEKYKMNDLLNNLDENKELNSASKKKKEKERCLGAIEKLKDEQREQEQHTQRVKEWLKHEQDNWIPSKSSKNESVTQLLQLCIFPRCVFTASDAIFCAKFVHMLHNLKTPNFSTLLCFDRVFSDISYTVTTLTESEASRYGRFLASMLEIVMRWHKDKKTYEKECGSYPGFVTVLRTTNTDKAEHLDYENFRHVCHKWQYKLTKALVVCLESKDYTQIRNTIMVLIKILPHYPKVSNLGMALERRVERICEEEKDKRKDLYALAIGYAGKLRTHKSEMISEGMFHRKAPDTKDKVNVISINTSQNATSQADIKQEVDEKVVTSQVKSEKPVTQDEKTKTSESVQVNDVEDSKSTSKQSSSQSIASEKSSSTSLKKSSSSNGVKSSTSLTTKKSSSNITSNDIGVKSKSESSKSNSNSTKSKESKESDREKQNAKESDKSRNHDKPEKSKRPSPNVTDSPRDDYDKESKRRKVDKSDSRISSPASSKESTPIDGSSSKSREERSKSKERDREKEKSHKSDRKRTSDIVEVKEVKRRKEDDDASPLRKSVDEKPKEKEKQEEKAKTTIIKLSRNEDGVKKEREKTKDKEKEKYKDKTKVKDKDKDKEKDKDKDKEKDKEKDKDKEKKKKSEEKSSSSKKESKSKDKEKEKDKETKDEEKSQKKQHSHSESRRSR